MGSATREALAEASAKLSALSGVDLATGEQLFAAGRALGESGQLRAALADPSADASSKQVLVARVFSQLSPATIELLQSIAAARWSNQDDLLAGVEEIAIRATARSAPATVNIVAELFAFGSAVTSDSELELAVGSKLGSPAAKAELVKRLMGAKASAHTVAILEHLVQQPRGRRIAELLRTASSIVADQAGTAVATVSTAVPLSSAQLERLRQGLAAQFKRALQINQVIDPSVLGGLRVQVGNDVIDGSIASKLNDLRLQLAG
ncbi:MAG: F0F1 ATP synthase subunit delta [Microbacteriaceae bacterium]